MGEYAKRVAAERGGRKRIAAWPLRAERRAATRVRAEATAALSPAERLRRLDQLLGPGMGARKERARLRARMVEEARKPRAAASA